MKVFLSVALLLATVTPTIALTPPAVTAAAARLLTRDEEEAEDMADTSLPLGSTAFDSVRDEALIKDINIISNILSDIVNAEDPKVHDLYEKFRTWGLERAEELSSNKNEGQALRQMVEAAQKLTAKEALGVVRTLAVMLNLVNSAEVQHRIRTTRRSRKVSQAIGGPLPLLEDSMRGTIEKLIKSQKASPDDIMKQLAKQHVEIVLTAHPTQVQRKSLLRKYRQVTDTLSYLDQTGIDEYEREAASENMKKIISSIWGADEIRRVKPTVQQEASGGNAVIEGILWDAVPNYLRKLDNQCRISLGKRLPVDVCPIRFASWIGGDRDGNPNVTPEVTKEVVLQQRLRAARLILRDLQDLISELAISSNYSKEMLKLADSVYHSFHKREKYRRVLGHLIDRLTKSARLCEQELATIEESGVQKYTVLDDIRGEWKDAEPIRTKEDLLKPLMIMYNSLIETGYELVADGALADIIRRLHVFGLSLVPLDIREESTKHMEAIDAITRWLGIGSYREWSEEAKLAWLSSELSNKRPLYRNSDIATMGLDAGVLKTLRVFETISKFHPSELGAYVISQAQTASDVLAVMLLQKQYGMNPGKSTMMRVVPLFETLNDLNNAPDVLKTLFGIPTYVGAVRGKQEVMVGYSDSAKDAGRLAACWAQFISQEQMAGIADKFGVELTFFHGKGGTVARGANPSVYRSIMSHPPRTINGRFRVTEQGEMIMQNFGALSIAERTIDVYTSAVCREAFIDHVEPQKEWRNEMQKISDRSCDAYRYLVREEPRFVPYFRQATPELELGSLNIGSRPAKRNPKGGIESLRAIPWTFAWAQTRTHLSAWLGVGTGLTAQTPEERALLRTMYKEWPWFRENVDLITMIMSKTDFSISKNYDEQLVDKSSGLDKLGDEVRQKLVTTRKAILDVTESKDFAGAHAALMRASSTIRNPYCDPVNVIQAELLKRVRKMEKMEKLSADQEEELNTLKDALIISINGIAQGMRNSG